MGRRTIVAGPSQRIAQRVEDGALAKARARAETWAALWAEHSPGYDATALLDRLRTDAGVRAVHFTAELVNNKGRAKLAIETMRDEAICAMTLALRDPELATAAADVLAEMRAVPVEAAAAVLEAPGDARTALYHVAWLFFRAISEPTDVTRYTYPEAWAAGEHVSAVSDVPRLGEREFAWVQRFLNHPDEQVRGAVANQLGGFASYLRDHPVAQVVLARLEDPACELAALEWAAYRSDLAPIARLERLLSQSAHPGRVWYVLVQRGQAAEAIAAFSTVDENTQESLVLALSDHGGRRGRDFLLRLLKSEGTARSLRRSIVTRFSERGEAAIVRRFEHLFDP